METHLSFFSGDWYPPLRRAATPDPGNHKENADSAAKGARARPDHPPQDLSPGSAACRVFPHPARRNPASDPAAYVDMGQQASRALWHQIKVGQLARRAETQRLG